MVPGTSRSMATILGGRLMGLGRKTAAEYSFFAAVPVLLLAGVYDLAKGWDTLQRSDLVPYAVGMVVSFFVARISIRFLMRIISHHTLEGFGWYRIGLSLIVWWTLV
jgi:undecaprenyl-diphosphatase